MPHPEPTVSIDQAVRDLFPGVTVGIIIARGIDNAAACPACAETLQAAIAETAASLGEDADFAALPEIAPWRAAYAAGVDPLRQLTDLLGIASGGPDGRRLMGLGFPEQTILWDGSAIEATAARLLDAQGDPLPWRSGDVPSGFNSSLW